MRHKRILRKFKIRNIFEVFIVLSILIVSVSSAIVVMTTDPEYSVQFIAGNETYIADETMDFSIIIIDSTYIIFNDTGFYLTSPNDITITLVYINDDIAGASDGDKVVEFNADTSGGDVLFDLSGFPAGNDYVVKRDGDSFSYPTADSSGYISFSSIVDEDKWFEILQVGESVENNPPYAPSNPNPANQDTNADPDIILSWTGGDPDGDPVTYDVYFGTANNPPQIKSGQSSSNYDPGTLNYETTYYWKIVNRDNRGESTSGPIWDFTTVANNPPYLPSNPSPDNDATNVDTNAYLSWSGGDPDGDPVTYDVYVGTTTSPSLVSSGQTSSSYDPGTMSTSTKYYWKIYAWDDNGKSTAGSLWSFTTRETPNNPPENPVKPSGPSNAGVDLPTEYTTSTADPNDDQMHYKWDWGDGNFSVWLGPYDSDNICLGSYSWEKTGNYSIKVKARDIHYAESDWSPSTTVTVLEIGPKADAGGSYVGFEDESIQFSGSATDGEEPYSWSWDFGDEKGTSSQQNPTYIYDIQGDYTVTLTVTDSNEDSDVDYADVQVAQNGTLVVKSGGPYIGFTEKTVEFTGSVIGGTPPYYWQWNFGDGDISDEQNPSHIYTDTGQYEVTFTVTDSKGLTGDDTTTATISEREKDMTPPIADITKPEERSLYLLNSKVRPSFVTRIIGRIDIMVEAYDNESDIYSVKFYIDGELKSTDINAPYIWTWDENVFFHQVIRVVVYDDAGNYVIKEMNVWKFF